MYESDKKILSCDILNLGVSPPGEPKGVTRAAGCERSVIRVPCDVLCFKVRFVVEEKRWSDESEVEEGAGERRLRRCAMRKTELARRRMTTDMRAAIRMVEWEV